MLVLRIIQDSGLSIYFSIEGSSCAPPGVGEMSGRGLAVGGQGLLPLREGGPSRINARERGRVEAETWNCGARSETKLTPARPGQAARQPCSALADSDSADRGRFMRPRVRGY